MRPDDCADARAFALEELDRTSAIKRCGCLIAKDRFK